MKNLTYLGTLPLLLIFCLASCVKKMEVMPSSATTNTANTATVQTAPAQPATPPAVTVNRTLPAGTGSGVLNIDGIAIGVKCNDVIKVKGGNYTNINIKNINIGCPVVIQNDGLVQISGSDDHMNIKNVSNLTISGAGTTGIDKGFVSKDNPSHRSIIINGATHDLTINNFSFQNIGDYVIFYNNGELVYNGSESSFSENIKFLNIDCNNTQNFLQMDGDASNGVVKGLVKNLEIANLNFTNSDCGYVAFIGNADNYNIHHNTVTNINQNNNNHNGIFTVKGSGSFHHNLFRNHQGNAIRAWARSIGSTPKEVLIYNNTVVNSRKYSGFEVQSFQVELLPGKTTYANAKVYNNICGNLNLSKDWVGVVVDVYSLFGGTVSVYNNTGFNFPSPGQNSLVANVQSTTTPVLSNNSYFATAQEAGIADVNALKIQP